jgi:hypothetical protein
MATRLKRFAVFVFPEIGGDVTPLLKDRLRLPILRFARKPITALEHQHLAACFGKATGQGATTGTTADDQHFNVFIHGWAWQ